MIRQLRYFGTFTLRYAAFLLAGGLFFISPQLANAALLNASYVLGQGGSYTTRTINYPSGTTNALGLKGVDSLTLDLVHHRLFTSEAYSSAGGTFNNRILVFQLDDTNHLATTTPSYVLGTCDFTTPGSGNSTQATFGGGSVVNLYYDSANDRLFVSASAQNRVLGFDVSLANIHNCETASFVIGQTNFTNSTAVISQSGMHAPDNVAYDTDNNRLFVSQQFGNRVTAYNIPPGAGSEINGENALFVLGQSNFTNSSSAATQSGMNSPTGIFYDNITHRLFVSDYSNNRMTAYSVAADATTSINGENALFVLGQPDFTTVTAGVTQTKMSGADDMDYDPATNRLIVGDVGNNRVLVFIVPPNAGIEINGENAQNVINESTWTDNSSGLTQNKFLQPDVGQHDFDPVNNILYDYELYGNRIVEFDMIHITNSSLAAGTMGGPYSQTITTEHGQGTTTTFRIYSGTLPTGLSLNSANGVISGTPTAPTSSVIQIEADDSSATGPFFNMQNFTLNVTDVTAPAATLKNPSAGVVTGTVALSASSTDNVAVAGTQFYVDGTKIGSEVTSTSGQDTYSSSWDTTGIADGTHTLVAVARDSSNNYATSTGVVVTVDNTAPARSGASPSSVPPGTTSTTISLSTNEVATCKYSTNSGTPYGSMTAFATTGGTTHSTAVSGFSNGNIFTYYVKCQDGQGNTNNDDYSISFTVSNGGGSFGGSSAPWIGITIQQPIPPATTTGTTTGTVHGGTPDNSTSVNFTNITPGTFYRDLKINTTGDDVKALQQYLNSQGFLLASSGPGSPGNETMFFGPLTQAAVIRFQKAGHISPPVGYFGPITRAYVQANHATSSDL